VAIGDDANKTKLAEFTGSMESVLEVHNGAELRKMIRFVSVRASQVASKSVQAHVPPVSGAASASGMAAVSQTPAAISQAPTVGPGVPLPAADEPTMRQAALNEEIAAVKAEAMNSGDDEW
jgi:hypothetical protein